ncbi:MAG: hypothetical protein AB8B69_27480 [Chitinophagales bacterium]
MMKLLLQIYFADLKVNEVLLPSLESNTKPNLISQKIGLCVQGEKAI